MIDLELFAGAGGLTLGMQGAGFRPRYLFEKDPVSCATLRYNRVSTGGLIHGEVVNSDISKMDWSTIKDQVRLISGGAPCQPFSTGGKHLANHDERNLFPEVFRAIRSLRPQAVLLENVFGFARPSFKSYFDYILHQLEFPSLSPRKGESWSDHHHRILRHRETTVANPEYFVSSSILNAADYGIPQTRKRIFLVASRSDSLAEFGFPDVSHSRNELLLAQETGEYWSRHNIEPRSVTVAQRFRVDHNHPEIGERKPWRTVRECISGLPEPAEQEGDSTNNHWSIHGARLYPKHTGCNLDWPAKTIKAGVHGIPGGENIVILDDGDFRYFTLRETARIQGFPDDYVFCGPRSTVVRQIGNAVPCQLASIVAYELFRLLEAATTED